MIALWLFHHRKIKSATLLVTSTSLEMKHVSASTWRNGWGCNGTEIKLAEVKLLLSAFGLKHSITTQLLIVGIIYSLLGLNAYKYTNKSYIPWPKAATSIFKHHLLQNLPPAKQQSPISHRIYHLIISNVVGDTRFTTSNTTIFYLTQDLSPHMEIPCDVREN